MKLSTWCVALTCVASVFLASCATDPVNPDGSTGPRGVFNIETAATGELIPDQYIVVLKEGAGIQGANTKTIDAVVNDITTANGIPSTNVLFVYRSAIRGFAVGMTSTQAQTIRKDDRVKFVEQDQVMRNPTIMAGKPGGGGGGGGSSQSTPWGITRVGGAGNGVGKVAWIIDTGIDLDHADLNVDVTRSRVFGLKGTDGVNADDGNGHGTHVSGTIAAKNNTTFVVGVAAGATVVAVKVLSKTGTGSNAGVIAGVDYVAGAAAAGDVANMSLGGGASTALDNAVTGAANHGVKMCLAAGNEGADAGNSSPSRVNGTNIYTVSAIDASNIFATWSNWGNPPVDYAAPGVSILSLWKGGTTNTISGTSMATPHVAGILLLGAVTTDGYAVDDTDGNADPVAHR